MKIGDLVQKTGGFGAECGWVGLIVDIKPAHSDFGFKIMALTVVTEEGMDEWLEEFCEVISERA